MPFIPVRSEASLVLISLARNHHRQATSRVMIPYHANVSRQLCPVKGMSTLFVAMRAKAPPKKDRGVMPLRFPCPFPETKAQWFWDTRWRSWPANAKKGDQREEWAKAAGEIAQATERAIMRVRGRGTFESPPVDEKACDRGGPM